MDILLEDGVLVVDLELGLEVGDVVGEVAAVGAATSVGEAEVMVRDIIVHSSPMMIVLVRHRLIETRWRVSDGMYIPIASARTVLLHLLRVNICKAMLCKVTWEMLRRGSSALGEALVVSVIGLVGASH